MEPEGHAGNLERREGDAAQCGPRRIDRDVVHVIHHGARGELGTGRARKHGPAIQRWIAREAGEVAGVPLRLLGSRMQQEGKLGAPQEKARQRVLFGKAHVFAGAAHPCGTRARARQETRRHVAARQLRVVQHALERSDRARSEQCRADVRRIERRQLHQAARERVVPALGAVQSRQTRLEAGDPCFHTALERRDAVLRAFETLDGLPRFVERREIGRPCVLELLERGVRGIERRADS